MRLIIRETSFGSVRIYIHRALRGSSSAQSRHFKPTSWEIIVFYIYLFFFVFCADPENAINTLNKCEHICTTYTYTYALLHPLVLPLIPTPLPCTTISAKHLFDFVLQLYCEHIFFTLRSPISDLCGLRSSENWENHNNEFIGNSVSIVIQIYIYTWTRKNYTWTKEGAPQPTN